MRFQSLGLIAAFLPGAAAADPPAGLARFDGAWVATVSCSNYAGALGYAFDVPSEVKDGVLHGERLHPGEPGWLLLEGRIEADGQARLTAKGLVGAAPMAVGQRPKGTDYGYHVAATFEATRGSGARIEGRPCDLVFVRR